MKDTDRKRHLSFFRIAHMILKPVFVKKFNYSYDSLAHIKGPYILLANHNMEMDPVLLGIAAKNQVYFVASEHVMRKGIGTKLLMRYLDPIIHAKGKMGLKTVSECLRRTRAGYSVAIFPEGNRSFNGITGEIFPATGKLVKKSGVPLITYKFEGGFLTQPRFSVSLRKGHVIGHFVKYYSPEELAKMTDEEVNEAIYNDIYENAIERQKTNPHTYLGEGLAVGMESTFFVCPSCRRMGTLKSLVTSITCDTCGFEATYDNYGFLKGNLGDMPQIPDWDALQYRVLKERLESPDFHVLFSDHISIYKIDDDTHEIISEKEGEISVYHDKAIFTYSSGEKKSFPMDEIKGAAIFSRNILVCYIGKDMDHFEIHGDENFNALKYLYYYQLRKGE